MSLPRILVIDDQLAQPLGRYECCRDWNLIDVTDGPPRHPREGPPAIAEASFCSGQVRDGSATWNSLELIIDRVASEWPSREGRRWALVLLDVRFDSVPPREGDGEFGLEIILKQLIDRWPAPDNPGVTEVPVVVMTREGHRRSEANKIGAERFLAKDEMGAAALATLLRDHGLVADSDLLGRRPEELVAGRSLALLRTLRHARRIANSGSNGTGMILGPQGSGKTTIAHYIHAHSSRSGPFEVYTVHPQDSGFQKVELFGSWPLQQQMSLAVGKAECAHSGTLFLDEVHHLRRENQALLLEFCRPIGGVRVLDRHGRFPTDPREANEARRSVCGRLRDDRKVEVDVLFLSASNEPLDEVSARARLGFDESLFTRLAQGQNSDMLKVPDLRARREDIPLLFAHFLELATHRVRGRWPKVVATSTLEQLMTREWPGNVDELAGVARIAAERTADFSEVLPRHLPTKQSQQQSLRHVPVLSGSQTQIVPSNSARQEAPSPSSLRWAELPRLLSEFEVPSAPEALHGSLQALLEAFGELVSRVLETALKSASATTTRGHVLPAMRLLLGVTSTSTAYSRLLLLQKLLFSGTAVASESALGKALAEAARNRRERAGRAKKTGIKGKRG